METDSQDNKEIETSKEDSTESFTYEVDVPVDPAISKSSKTEAVESKSADSKTSDASTEKSKKETKEVKEPSIFKDLSPEQEKLPWYVVHTYSGHEALAKANLEERIRQNGLENKFGNIIVPQEKVVELHRGEKKTSMRKFFPGYIVVQMEINQDTWHLLKDTPKVTGFVGDAHEPMPMLPEEVENLKAQMLGSGAKPRVSTQFSIGDSVKVVDGPFAEFNGTIDEVKADKGKLRVLISIFGRNTPVELDFIQVEKV